MRFSSPGAIGCVCVRRRPEVTVVRSPWEDVLSPPSCDDMCCLSIVSLGRDQLPASGQACLQWHQPSNAAELVHQPCGKGQRATTWTSPRWSRTANSPLAPDTYRVPARVTSRLLRGGREQIQISAHDYLWHYVLTRAETWGCTDADEENVFWDSSWIIRGQRQERLRMLGSWKTLGGVSQASQSTQCIRLYRGDVHGSQRVHAWRVDANFDTSPERADRLADHDVSCLPCVAWRF